MDTKKKLLISIWLSSMLFFVVSALLRLPWHGVISDEAFQFNTGRTVVFASHWIKEGIFSSPLLMLENPATFEFTSLASRLPYLSYLPGAVLPIFFIATATSQDPSVSMVMSFNLFCQLVIGIILSTWSFLLAVNARAHKMDVFFFSLVPSVLYFFLPAPFYFHHNVYFTDQAVMLPFVLFVFFEALQKIKPALRSNHWLFVVQSLIFFYGIWCDWYFLLVALVVFALRVIEARKTKSRYAMLIMSLQFWLPAIFSLSFFIIQNLLSGQGFDYVYNAADRGMGIHRFWYYIQLTKSNFWDSHMVYGYGEHVLFIAFTSLLFFVGATILAIKKSIVRQIVFSAILLMIPPLLYLIVFPRNSIGHGFSTLKFAPWIAMVPFSLIPITFLALSGKSRVRFLVIPIVSVLLTGFIAYASSGYGALFPPPDRSTEAVGEFVKQSLKSERTIVFTTDHAHDITSFSPAALTYAGRRIYFANSIGDIHKKVKTLSDPYDIALLIDSSVDECSDCPGFSELKQNAYFRSVEKNMNLSLYLISSDDYIASLTQYYTAATHQISPQRNMLFLLNVKKNICLPGTTLPVAEQHPFCNTIDETIRTALSSITKYPILAGEIQIVDFSIKKSAPSKGRIEALFWVPDGISRHNDYAMPLLIEAKPLADGAATTTWNFIPSLTNDSWIDDTFLVMTEHVSVQQREYDVWLSYRGYTEKNETRIHVGIITVKE